MSTNPKGYYCVVQTEIEESIDLEFAAALAAYARRLYINMYVNRLTECPLCILHYTNVYRCREMNIQCIAKSFCFCDNEFERVLPYDLMCSELKKRNLSYDWLPEINEY